VFVQADAQADLHNCKVKRRRDRLLTERPSESPLPNRCGADSAARVRATRRGRGQTRVLPGAVGQTSRSPTPLPPTVRRACDDIKIRKSEQCLLGGGKSVRRVRGHKAKSKPGLNAFANAASISNRHRSIRTRRRACNGAAGGGGWGESGCERAAGKKLIMD